jgi:hypothetical protein
MGEQLVQLFEICNEAHGAISEDEIAALFPVQKDWADRLCLTVDDARKARLLGLEQWEAWKQERAASV